MKLLPVTVVLPIRQKMIRYTFFKKLETFFPRILKYCVTANVVFFRCSHKRHPVRKVVLRNFEIFTGKQLSQSVLFFNKVADLKKETLAEMFSCKFWEICKNTFFYGTLLGDCFCFLTIWKSPEKFCVFRCLVFLLLTLNKSVSWSSFWTMLAGLKFNPL